MSLETFLDIRLGDPAISVSLNYNGLAFGTMMGRLVYYNFSTQQERVINELSEEYIPGVWLSSDNTLYASIGDAKVLIVSSLHCEKVRKHYFLHDKPHTSANCQNTQVQMSQDSVCLFSVEPDYGLEIEIPHLTSPVFVAKLSLQATKRVEGVRFPPYSMPFDFDEERLLWMEWQAEGNRVLNILKISGNAMTSPIAVFPKQYGKVSFARLLNDIVVFVHNFRKIKVLDIVSGEEKFGVGVHKSDVVALKVVRFVSIAECSNLDSQMNMNTNIRTDSSRNLLLSADLKGYICIWDADNAFELAEVIHIPSLVELTKEYRKKQYFGMGYPYVINCCGPRIAISTDYGVLVIKSRFLESIGVVHS